MAAELVPASTSNRLRARSPSFAPAGQSMQMIVGASAATDATILTAASSLYLEHGLRRVYYSAFSPIPDLWRIYYANIFNPARVNARSMRAELPKMYWKNLPEAGLVERLLRGAPVRARRMVAGESTAATEPALRPRRAGQKNRP